MTAKLKVRRLRWSDVPALFRTASQAFTEDARYPLQSFDNLNSDWRYVAEVDGVMAGFLFGCPMKTKREGVQISLLGIDPKFQGQGVGRRLVSAIEKNARRKGYRKCSTGTPFARGFYEQCGYELTQVHYALTKSLVGTNIAPSSEIDVGRGDFEDLATVIQSFTSRDRSAFLKCFFDVYRDSASRVFLAFTPRRGKQRKVIGAGIAKVNAKARDLIEVIFLNGNTATQLALLSHLEYQASKEGARRIGVTARKKNFCNTLVAQGYEIAHAPEWWTIYYLAKGL